MALLELGGGVEQGRRRTRVADDRVSTVWRRARDEGEVDWMTTEVALVTLDEADGGEICRLDPAVKRSEEVGDAVGGGSEGYGGDPLVRRDLVEEALLVVGRRSEEIRRSSSGCG